MPLSKQDDRIARSVGICTTEAERITREACNLRSSAPVFKRSAQNRDMDDADDIVERARRRQHPVDYDNMPVYTACRGLGHWDL